MRAVQGCSGLAVRALEFLGFGGFKVKKEVSFVRFRVWESEVSAQASGFRGLAAGGPCCCRSFVHNLLVHKGE